VRQHVGCAGRAFALEPLVALDPAVRGIAELAFFEHDLDTVDAAVALVDEGVIVGNAVGERNAVRRISARPINQLGDELLVLCLRRPGDRGGAQDGAQWCRERDSETFPKSCIHGFFLLATWRVRPQLSAMDSCSDYFA